MTATTAAAIWVPITGTKTRSFRGRRHSLCAQSVHSLAGALLQLSHDPPSGAGQDDSAVLGIEGGEVHGGFQGDQNSGTVRTTSVRNDLF